MKRKVKLLIRGGQELYRHALFRVRYRAAHLAYGAARDKESIMVNFFRNFSPVFVLSTGRCGTEYLTEVLRAARNADIYHEPYPQMGFGGAYAYAQHVDPIGCAAAILCARFEYLFSSYINARAYLETNNRATFLAHGIEHLFRNAKYIHLVRHPGAFVRSGIRRGYYSEEFDSPHGKIMAVGTDTCDPVARIGALWNETNKFILDFLDTVPAERKLIIRAEELFGSTTNARQIMQYCGCYEWSERRLRGLIEVIHNKQESGDFPPYKEWSTEMKEQLKDAAPLASIFKYEL